MLEPNCHRFTAAEGGARLAATASTRNTLITEYASFISIRLIHEEAYSIRGLLSSGKKRSIRICRASTVKPDAYELRILTDLKVMEAAGYEDVGDWRHELEVNEVLVCTSQVLKNLLENGLLTMVQINVLVIDSCHLIYRDENLKYIMHTYKQTDEQTRPRILAITYPIFSQNPESIDIEPANNTKPSVEDIDSKDGTVDKDIVNKETVKDKAKIIENIDKVISKDKTIANENKALDAIDKNVGTSGKAIDSVDKKVDIQDKNVDSITKIIENRENTIDNKDKMVDNEAKIIENRDKDIDTSDSVDSIEKSVENKGKAIDSQGKNIEIEDTTVANKDIIIDNKDKAIDAIDRSLENTKLNIDTNDKDNKEATIDSKVNTIENKESATDKEEDRVLKKKHNIKIGVYENKDDFVMYEKLEWRIEQLEEALCCKMDLAEDIDICKRLSASVPKPRELIIEYETREKSGVSDEYKQLVDFMETNVNEALDFLYDHRHDPTELYGEDMFEELKNIPDPTVDPITVFMEFLYILNELGPYAADKAAFTLLIKLEKLKVKVPYERHFLLLRMCTTVLVKIRCFCDVIYSRFNSELDKIKLFSTPKLMRLVEILEKFTPTDQSDISNIKSDRVDIDIGKIDRDDINEDIKIDSKDRNNIRNNININKETIKSGTNITNINIAKDADDIDSKKINTDTDIGSKKIMKLNKETIKSDITNIDTVVINKDQNTITITEDNVNIKDNIDINITEKDIMSIKIEDNKNKDTNNGLNKNENVHINLKDSIINNDSRDKDNIDIKNDINTKDTDTNINANKIQNTKQSDSIIESDKDRDDININKDSKDNINIENKSDINKLLSAIQNCDFASLGDRIEDKLNTLKGNLKDLDINLDIKDDSGTRPRRGRQRRTRVPRFVRNQHITTNSLCGVIFVDEQIMAKILFIIVAELSRCLPSLSYITCQYCVIESNPELTDQQKQAKRHEEVLKKFRMHECNLLVSTLALQEGIDLPRCNLVLRWDPPHNYRSHILCRSRGRAPRAAAALLGAARTLIHNLATYTELDSMITRKCGCGIQNEPTSDEESEADGYNILIQPYTPHRQTDVLKDKIYKEKQNEIKKYKNSGQISVNNVSDGQTSVKTDHNKVIDGQTSVNQVSCGQISVSDGQLSVNKVSDGQTSVNTVSGGQISLNNISDGQTSVKTVHNKVSDGQTSVNKVSDCQIIVNKCDSESESVASVDLNSAIALINRYCAKLPSDTFTRLAPQWWIERVRLPDEETDAYICTLRLPLNCPVKYNIVGHPMPSRVLARRAAALQACRVLHRAGELDHHLTPVSKDNFKAAELENMNTLNGNVDKNDIDDIARPGTTKRRQYYYKRTASAFTDCQPVIDTSDSEIDPPNGAKTARQTDKQTNTKKDASGKRNTLYWLSCSLQCALPERYNTRGRALHAPQHADTALALLMATRSHRLQIPSFPVYTRSGEVRVSVEHVPDADVRMSPRRAKLVRRFMRFVFTEVLRVRRKGMKLQSEGTTKNNYYIVPTIKTTRPDGTTKIDVDWEFLEVIYKHTEEKKQMEVQKPSIWTDGEEGEVKKNPEKCVINPLLKPGEVFVFDPDKYKEAVVTPWYRNQDQPQFFLVAEICWNLSPDSAFPSYSHATFRSYYRDKYHVELTQPNQPLLDVDHTSARLNLLTPRYVNRKGVALPVSSERTRRAKRDRLDQKQILVPELCRTHPFQAPLWFATVALPCILYRMNALLLADEVRGAVSRAVGVGAASLPPTFNWPPLHFGWSLAEVLSADAEKSEKRREDERQREQRERESRDEDESVGKEIALIEKREKTINDILQEREDFASESGFEIGTWSNDMASSIPDSTEYDDLMEPLPSNLTFCTSASGGMNWCDTVNKPKLEYNTSRQRTFSMADSDCSFMSSDFDTDDSDFDSDGSDDDADGSGFCNSKNSNAAVGVRIEYKTPHEAEAVDVECKRNTIPAPQRDLHDDMTDRQELIMLLKSGDADEEYIKKFRQSVETHKQNILNNNVIESNKPIQTILPEPKLNTNRHTNQNPDYRQIFPYKNEDLEIVDGQVTIASIERNKIKLLDKLKKNLSADEIKKLQCFSMTHVDIDSPGYVNEKIANIGFDSKEIYEEKLKNFKGREFVPYYNESKAENGFDFDFQPDLEGHPGPSPSIILQALTMSNANDGINLERLETIGDSFLKFAITAYLYCAHPTVHEGKLSHMRSKQVSNLNLYRLGRSVRLGARMIATKFEPHDNWLPPCHRPPHPHTHASDSKEDNLKTQESQDANGCFIPYNLITQHSIPDKSVADCVEALIGAYLVEMGARGALLFMSWLGIRVLPQHVVSAAPPCTAQKCQTKTKPSKRVRTYSDSCSDSECSSQSQSESESDDYGDVSDDEYIGPVGARPPYQDENGDWKQIVYGELKAPPSPLLRYISDPEGELERMLSGYEELERTLSYRFKDRSLLLQALTHASHHTNTLTDCYQRLEFLGDAILDYLITRHLYEDARRHSPGALTDLRSALVNNTIFATLAVRHGFHKYFRHMSPGLSEVLTKYVKIQEENGHSISEEHYLIQEDEEEQAEDVEVPKALGDLFESVAGAIFLDSGMSLGAVWRSYVVLMGAELDAFSAAAPRSPVRELLEAEPDTAKFGKPERLADGRRVRVCVEVFGRGTFKGIGRNYRIAKGTAARCALRHLKIHRR